MQLRFSMYVERNQMHVQEEAHLDMSKVGTKRHENYKLKYLGRTQQ